MSENSRPFYPISRLGKTAILGKKMRKLATACGVDCRFSPVVHAVAGDQHLGLDLRQGPFQPLVNARPWKRVARFGKAGSCLAGKADAHDIERLIGVPLVEIVCQEAHIASVLGDTVAKDHDPFTGEILYGECRLLGGGIWVSTRADRDCGGPLDDQADEGQQAIMAWADLLDVDLSGARGYAGYIV